MASVVSPTRRRAQSSPNVAARGPSRSAMRRIRSNSGPGPSSIRQVGRSDSWSDGVETEAYQPAPGADPEIALIHRNAGHRTRQISRCHDRSDDLSVERSVTEPPLSRHEKSGVITNKGMKPAYLRRQDRAQRPSVGSGIAPEHALRGECDERVRGPFDVYHRGLEGGTLLEPYGLHQIPLPRKCHRQAGLGANPDSVAFKSDSERRVGERRGDRLDLQRVAQGYDTVEGGDRDTPSTHRDVGDRAIG